MTGYENFNYQAFHEAAAFLRGEGWEVFNPAESFNGDKTRDRTEYMRHDLAEVTRCTHIAVLDYWFRSRGARAEMRVAMECGLVILNAESGTVWSSDAVSRIRDAASGDGPLAWACGDAPLSDTEEMEALPLGETGTQQFATGAVRDTQTGKPRPELISPFASYRLGLLLAKACEPDDNGQRRYPDRNWEAGLPMDRVMASALRHLNAHRRRETNEDHLTSAYCNIMFLLDHDERIKRGLLPPELNDMPKYI